ncbi:hypothetical protein K3U93_18525 [Mycobacterium malmoense]|uniref:Uncharacterized protein n=2 Tax=Mycobacterium malmoense TaxID=1780 RepID=A0ABX3SRH6_MYCMA|nr:hypothetical protein [Mycobacterium malmoense]OIN82677.1 hypothetical protein BMG05_01055 [Mycobacterium malmoense]ORA82087.1 hypothetical protein BST29_12915 [Mycobacterium malmoense]QZA16630.1 hypothetical protein K3U93_18525 [Mycobacterium malmoense]UNB93430.1 hypothetical protein H5T25_18510 [Mycobacterium malmoense]
MRQDMTALERDKWIYEARRRGISYRRIARELDMTAAGVQKAMQRILAGGLGKGRDRRAQ